MNNILIKQLFVFNTFTIAKAIEIFDIQATNS